MKLHVLFGTLGIVSLVAVGCERRDGKIIIHEDKAEQKAGEALEKAGQGVKDLGEKAKEAGQRAKTDPDPKGVGGGPRDPAATEACDASVTDCPPVR